MDIGLSTYYFAKFEPEPVPTLRGGRPRIDELDPLPPDFFEALDIGNVTQDQVRRVREAFINWGDDEPEQQRDDEEEV
jgi:hypothetical protein